MVNPQGSNYYDCRYGTTSIVRPSTINSNINKNDDHDLNYDQLFYNDMNRLIDSILNHSLRLSISYKPTPPQRVGYFSSVVRHEGSQDTYHPDTRCLTYLKPNYRDYKNMSILFGCKRQDRCYRIPNEIGYILHWASDPSNQPTCSNVNFICTSSRILRSILNARYNPVVKWSLLAIKIGSTIILTHRDPSSYVKNSYTRECNENTFIGFKFTEMITLKSNERRPKVHFTGNRNSFYMVNRLEVGQHRILYPARIDCLIDKSEYIKPIGLMQTAQIRNRLINQYSKDVQETNLHIAIGWWSSAFISGSETIICGEKTSPTRLKEITTIKTDSLYGVQVEGSTDQWTPKNCIEHLNFILDRIWSNVQEDATVYSFRWNRETKRVECCKLNESFLSYIPTYYFSRQF